MSDTRHSRGAAAARARPALVEAPLAALLAALLAAVLASCVGTPAYQAPNVSVARTYGAAGGATTPPAAPGDRDTASARSAHYSAEPASSPFWRDLGDTTLTRLVEEALRANTDVRVVEERLSGTRASRRLAALDLVPTVTGIGSATRQQIASAQFPGLPGGLPAQNLWDVGFDASWELDIFGRIGRNVGARSALVESAEHSLEDVRVSLAAEVARTYFDLRGAQRQLDVARRNAENQRRTLALTEDRLTAGRGTAFDTERARAVLNLTLAATPALESAISADRHRLAVLVGRAPGASPDPVPGAGDLPRLPDTVHVGSPEQLVRRRPDVLGAERQLAAQTLFTGAARAEYLPRLTLGANVGYTATSLDSLGQKGTTRLLIGPTLTWPLLDLGRVRERVDVAEAQRQEARAQYSSTVLRALEETETALVSYDRAHARLAVLGEAVRASAHAAELAQQRFEAGLTDLLQVLDAERTLLDAENQLAETHTAAATALVAVYKSVGGTWPIR
ncbi:MAG: efflux transporter outer membrane subunit [Gemmatimonadaceae bacterium]